jgi:tetratricopeptide (TPR) repeat protein
LVQSIRLQTSGDLAFQEGAALPLSVRLYTAGAVDFRRGNLSTATQRFQAILKLPTNDQSPRATWAAYMVGQTYARAGEVDKASAAFQLTRFLAIGGAPDPLGLAVASYGEEARLHLARAASYLTGPGSTLPAERRDDYRREIAAAVILYAEQAARGSRSGVNSLRTIAQQLLQPDPKHDSQMACFDASIGDATVLRLWVAYALARFEDMRAVGEPIDAGRQFQLVEPHGLRDLLRVTNKGPGVKHIAGADRLAALAYGSGEYDLARQLTDQTTGPMASWVKAKLALQQGDLKRAAAFYAEASEAFPPAGEPPVLEDGNVKRLTGESAVLALARGEYVDALEHLYPVAGTYWGDVAYIAERVLTTDELKHFVDAHLPAPALSQPESAAATDQTGVYYWPFQADPAVRLRDLLARRLVRDARYKEALAYFHPPQDRHFGDPNVRKHVTEYAQALHEATGDWRSINRARGWYRAAVLARESGMEMMGYEGEPDYHGLGGAFEWGLGQSNPGVSFVTEGESSRFEVSAAHPYQRFHYRYIAIEDARHSADLLPPRSQAFAAVLCKATGWMMSSRDDIAVKHLYHRYLKEGPYVPWAAHFGLSCPEPDFDGAARLPRVLLVRNTRHFVGHHRWEGGLTLALAMVAGALAFAGLRRRRLRQAW